MTSPFVSHGDELHLSNSGQLELLRAVVERGVLMRTTARGFSMTPFIHDGDVLTIAPLGGRQPEVGDVVAFTLSDTGRLAIHRVIARPNGGWLLRADNAAQADGVVPGEQLLGRVVRVERNGRRVCLGLGRERALIAALSLRGGMTILRSALCLPRRAAATALRSAQGLPRYRSAGRRLARPVEVSRATPAESASVRRHLNPLGVDATPTADANVTDWVAKRDGKVIGFVQYVCHPDTDAAWGGHWLFALTVWGRSRGLGAGEALTRRVIEHARARGAEELLLAVFEDNDRAIRLYRKLGFEHVTRAGLEPALAEEKAMSGRRRVIMRKRLGEKPAL